MSELKLCPFCKDFKKTGHHSPECYISLAVSNAVRFALTGKNPDNQNELDEAWNQRAEDSLREGIQSILDSLQEINTVPFSLIVIGIEDQLKKLLEKSNDN